MKTPNVQTYENKTLYLQAEDWKWYVIHPNGDIERTDMLHNPSGQWKMTGLGDGRVSFALSQITPEWRKDKDLEKFHVFDFDHGTLRQWGQFIRAIAFYDRPEDTPFYQYSKPVLIREAQERARTPAPVWG